MKCLKLFSFKSSKKILHKKKLNSEYRNAYSCEDKTVKKYKRKVCEILFCKYINVLIWYILLYIIILNVFLWNSISSYDIEFNYIYGRKLYSTESLNREKTNTEKTIISKVNLLPNEIILSNLKNGNNKREESVLEFNEQLIENLQKYKLWNNYIAIPYVKKYNPIKYNDIDNELNEKIDNVGKNGEDIISEMNNLWLQVMNNEKSKYLSLIHHLQKYYYNMKVKYKIPNDYHNEKWKECYEIIKMGEEDIDKRLNKMFKDCFKQKMIYLEDYRRITVACIIAWKALSNYVQNSCRKVMSVYFNCIKKYNKNMHIDTNQFNNNNINTKKYNTQLYEGKNVGKINFCECLINAPYIDEDNSDALLNIEDIFCIELEKGNSKMENEELNMNDKRKDRGNSNGNIEETKKIKLCDIKNENPHESTCTNQNDSASNSSSDDTDNDINDDINIFHQSKKYSRIPRYDTSNLKSYNKNRYYLDLEAEWLFNSFSEIKRMDEKTKNKKRRRNKENMNNPLSSDNSENVFVDKTYYDILNVNPDADFVEIKNSYYKLALKYHPDKNKGDEEAKLMFQKINEAYQVLSDEERREQYDNYGKNATENMFLIDGSFFFTLVFSSEKLCDYIGTLQISTFVKLVHERGMNSNDLLYNMREIQNKLSREQDIRETELALLLRDLLQPYVDGDPNWEKRMEEEISSLIYSNYSSSILKSIGWTYKNVAKTFIKENKSFCGLGAEITKMKAEFRHINNCSKVTRSAIRLNSKIFNSIQDNKKIMGNLSLVNNNKITDGNYRTFDNDSMNDEGESSSKNDVIVYDNNTTEIIKEKSKVVADILDDIFTIVLCDIELTVRYAADRVLRDEGCNKEIRLKRAEGIKIVGNLMNKWAKIKKKQMKDNKIDITDTIESALHVSRIRSSNQKD
ncbi:RESA-like protein with PHIST and DnaJ domains [Plasmodium reichenowi]|uniref:RESA-like protein with PHIST and DnaJ domains n=1 Tax=Plasmodium reichenowi TaxID=5854 RepID=A0A060RTX7_PLARE|nr:RESA-like protein with PHIST and DnaJ domains [Plasmodium reichenowi]